MKRLYRYFPALVAILMLAGAMAAHADNFPYKTLDYPGAQHTFAYGINNTGQIVGSYNGSPIFHADTARGYLLSGENYTPIDYPGGAPTVAYGINNTGQIVGQHFLNAGRYSFLLSGGNYTPINYPGARATCECAINDTGQIVGWYPTNYWHAFLLSAGAGTNIDPPIGWSFGANGINNAGQIVGVYYTGIWRGFLLSGGSYTYFGYPGASGTDANGINNAGQIVGTYYDGAGRSHGYLLSGGVYTSLDIPGALQTTAYKINDNGNFVGSYQDSAGKWHGFVSLGPVANAGINQTVHPGVTVTLDGSGSSDPGGNVPLLYAWTIKSKPANSNAALSDPTSVHPTFTPDMIGDYVVELVVTNSVGAVSPPATVTISTSNSPPTAAAGEDQAVTLIGTTVALNGSASFDPDGDSPLACKWTFVSRPADSNAAFNDDTSPTPIFTADKHGTYEVMLTVTDPWQAQSTDTMIVSFSNVRPAANAGSSQSVVIGGPVTANGSGSSDANGDTLTYSWSLASKPADSTISFNSLDMIASFTPDVPGDYVVQLIVNDGFEDSAASTASIHMSASRNWVSDQLRDVIADLGDTGLLPDAAFKNKNMRNALINKLNALIKDVDAGNYAEALAKLQEDVMAKTDGCAAGGAPDNNDWIATCPYQSIIYPELQDILGHLAELAQ
jgi:uncharacterized membrane protein